MAAKVHLPLADDLEEVLEAGFRVAGGRGGRGVVLGGRAARDGLVGLEALPLVRGHGRWFVGAGEVGVGFLEFAGEPAGVGGEDGACLHEF